MTNGVGVRKPEECQSFKDSLVPMLRVGTRGKHLPAYTPTPERGSEKMPDRRCTPGMTGDAS